MEEGRSIGTRDLILAIFRLAVADYLSVWYGHDEPAPTKRGNDRFQPDAAEFLRSQLAEYLADAAGLSARAIWLEAQRLASSDDQRVRAA